MKSITKPEIPAAGSLLVGSILLSIPGFIQRMMEGILFSSILLAI